MKLLIKFFKRLINSSRLKFLFFGASNLVIAQIILGILLLYSPIFFATFVSYVIQSLLNYITYSKYVFRFKNISLKRNLLIYCLYSIFIWIFYSSVIYFIHIIFGPSKNIVAILLLPIFIPFTYLLQKNIIFRSDF